MQFTKEFYESDAFIGNLDKALKKFLVSDFNKDRKSIIVRNESNNIHAYLISQRFTFLHENFTFSHNFHLSKDYEDFDLIEVKFDIDHASKVLFRSNNIPQLKLDNDCSLFMDRETVGGLSSQALYIPIKYPKEAYLLTETEDQFIVGITCPLVGELEFEFLKIPYTYEKKRKEIK